MLWDLIGRLWWPQLLPALLLVIEESKRIMDRLEWQTQGQIKPRWLVR